MSGVPCKIGPLRGLGGRRLDLEGIDRTLSHAGGAKVRENGSQAV